MSDDDEAAIRELERVLEEATAGMSDLERALFIAAEFRVGFGDEWVINLSPGGRYSITRVLPGSQKTL